MLAVTEEQIGILQEEKIPVEASIPMADNLSRLHINTCRQTGGEQFFPCEWQDTFLYERATAGELPTRSDQDIGAKIVNAQRLETAFNTVTGLGESKDASIRVFCRDGPPAQAVRKLKQLQRSTCGQWACIVYHADHGNVWKT